MGKVGRDFHARLLGRIWLQWVLAWPWIPPAQTCPERHMAPSQQRMTPIPCTGPPAPPCHPSHPRATHTISPGKRVPPVLPIQAGHVAYSSEERRIPTCTLIHVSGPMQMLLAQALCARHRGFGFYSFAAIQSLRCCCWGHVAWEPCTSNLCALKM